MGLLERASQIKETADISKRPSGLKKAEHIKKSAADFFMGTPPPPGGAPIPQERLKKLPVQIADISVQVAAVRNKLSEYQDRRRHRRASDRRQTIRYSVGFNTLTIQNLCKNFGKKEVVRGVGFSLRGGNVAGLLGPNGAGKTTIFYMIVGFLKPTAGDIKLNNASITAGPMYRRARMGVAYLPQEASIFRKLTVEQNIWAILESRRDLSKKQKKEHMEKLISDFGIGRIRTQPGYTLSGGERRRTEIARALAIEPKFLLLDEPFAGIDPIAVFEIKQIIKRLAAEGIGILITDHNVRDTLEITNDAFIINHGTIVARGPRELILNNETVRNVYLGNDFKM
jgi:lipopolysaccharide export system ATP-binding protein